MYFRKDEIRKLNPWRGLPTTGDFVLPQEKAYIEAYNAEQAKPENRVRLEIPPDPFVGSPDTARVLLLTKSPSWDERNIADYEDNPAYAQAMHQNLQFENEDYPFYYLNPAFAHTSGYQWWFPKLRELIEACQERLGAEEAQALVAKRVMTVAYFPYHVEKYVGTVQNMPSQKYSFGLVGALAQGGIPVVIQSHGKLWLKQMPSGHGTVITTNSAQSNFISRRNLPEGEFEKLLDLLTKD